MRIGKANISAGLLFLAAFMIYGFVLIYLRHLAPGKEQWAADYAVGTHLELRLAHVHGALFAFLNIVVGYLLIQLRVPAGTAKLVSWLALAGMLMPLGILGEVLLGTPMFLILVGAAAMTAAVAILGVAVARLRE